MRHKIDPVLLSDWDKKISCRLWNDLNELGTGAVVALEFHMAGENKKKLRPTIIITCEDEKSQKHNKEKIKGLRWLVPYNLKYCVVKNSDKRRLQAFTDAERDPFILAHDVVADLGNKPTTLCGVQASSRDRTTCDAARPFRLGGLIAVDGELFCLTAGHVMVLSHCGSSCEAAHQIHSSDTSSTTEIDGSSMIFMIGEGDGDDVTEVVSDASKEDEVYGPIDNDDPTECASTHDLSEINDWVVLGHFESHFSHENPLETQPAIPCSDWGLIKLKDRRHWLPNFVQMHGKASRTFIESIIPEDELYSGQVWAITDSGCPKPGFLSLGSAFVSLHDRGFRDRQISFDEALGM